MKVVRARLFATNRLSSSGRKSTSANRSASGNTASISSSTRSAPDRRGASREPRPPGSPAPRSNGRPRSWIGTRRRFEPGLGPRRVRHRHDLLPVPEPLGATRIAPHGGGPARQAPGDRVHLPISPVSFVAMSSGEVASTESAASSHTSGSEAVCEARTRIAGHRFERRQTEPLKPTSRRSMGVLIGHGAPDESRTRRASPVGESAAAPRQSICGSALGARTRRR